MPKKYAKIIRPLLVVSASFLVAAIAGNDIASANANAINNALKCSTFEIVKTGESSGDTEYFKSDHKDYDSLKEYCDEQGRLAEEEGLVLLKNENNALPLSEGDKVSLLGQGSVKTNYSTSGSSSASGVTYPAMNDVFSEGGLEINPTTTEFYTSGNGSKYGRTTNNLIRFVNETPWEEYDETTKSSLATYGDAAIVVFNRDSGEGTDLSTSGSDGEDGSYLSLSQEERDLLKGLSDLKDNGTIKKIVVLLNMACPMETAFLFDEELKVDSCLWIGNVGTNGLYGVINVLTGKATPSGHLSDTFLKDNLSSPAMTQWMNNPSSRFSQRFSNSSDYDLNTTQYYYAVYQESIYVGYRYYETRYEDMVMGNGNTENYVYSNDVSYPFGYGLSYTTFEQSNFSVSETDDTYEVSVTVTNTGSTYSGKDVVEVYLQKPYTEYDQENGVEKAAVELVGFEKTSTLAPGASETVNVSVFKEELKSYDSNKAKTYILDAGKYYLTAASDAHEATNNILAKKGYSVSDGMDSAGDSTLVREILDQKELDTETYSISKETGNPITNQCDFMDINKYENRGDNSVTYLSRSDWKGTWPSGSVTLTLNDAMAADLASNKEIKQNGETMPTYEASNGLQLINLRNTEEATIPYDDPNWDTLLDQMSYEDQAYLLTSSAFATPEIASVGKPATLDNDGPTGLVGTKTSTVMPSLAIWASSFNKELLHNIGDAQAEDALYAGYQGLYAPGINLHRTPFGGRLNEYFSEDSFLTGQACVEVVQGMQENGVIPTIKHYAFNNEETNRNGIGIWMNEQEARELNLKPFEMAMRPSIGNAHAIMTSFNRAGCIWTSAAPELMITINRDEWGFDGYSLTDMASSNGASYMTYDDGIYNGTDLFLGNGSRDALDAYKDNAAFAQRMREATHRVLYVICNYSAAMNGIDSNTKIVPITPWWQITVNVLIGVFAAFTVLSAGAYGFFIYYDKKKQSE